MKNILIAAICLSLSACIGCQPVPDEFKKELRSTACIPEHSEGKSEDQKSGVCKQ